MESLTNHSIVLFDGICNFCSGWVNHIIKHDKKNKFKFAAQQSEVGKKLLLYYGIDTSKTDSVILIENNKAYTKSTAALKICKHLNSLYPLTFPLILIPSFIRNPVYDVIAENRYKWFGKNDRCMIPSEEIKSKFINETDFLLKKS